MLLIDADPQGSLTASLGYVVLMLSWAVMISLCHAVMSLPGDLSRIVSFDGADIRPIKGKT